MFFGVGWLKFNGEEGGYRNECSLRGFFLLAVLTRVQSQFSLKVPGSPRSPAPSGGRWPNSFGVLQLRAWPELAGGCCWAARGWGWGGTGARREAERGGHRWGRALCEEPGWLQRGLPRALGLLQRLSRGAGRFRPGAPQHGLTSFWWDTSPAALLVVVSCPAGRVGAGRTQPCTSTDPAHSPAGDPAVALGAAGTGKGNTTQNAHPSGNPPVGPGPPLPVAA